MHRLTFLILFAGALSSCEHNEHQPITDEKRYFSGDEIKHIGNIRCSSLAETCTDFFTPYHISSNTGLALLKATQNCPQAPEQELVCNNEYDQCGCAGKSCYAGQECARYHECGLNFNRCFNACSKDTDCDPGQLCLHTNAPYYGLQNSACIDASCLSDADCVENARCVILAEAGFHCSPLLPKRIACLRCAP